ncbi:unnamed protein product [Kuraishia capsulata CBS 1993]|uniref:Peptidase M20 dimerisation domain-containing protein n=1 Tax=Kuraishia capsulata CBS 1993 TaxID=1382522 RepID=W6MFD1_9ASCO|nr:uncharacterized protein KUCA_T00000196001 [Kuraishia capsulata CBS 1993]CDK24236.1 unnamed protein product [Kuraishia capsulata CBS 1993]
MVAFEISTKKRRLVVGTIAGVIGVLGVSRYIAPVAMGVYPDAVGLADADRCPSLSKLAPAFDGSLFNLSYFHTPEYRNLSLDVWGGAVRIATPNYDDLGTIGEDPRWDVFFEFEDYLLKTFSTVASKAELHRVNTHGLVFSIAGSDPNLKPLMLTGHQDVVPVPPETALRWTHPPFDSYFDGKYLWGRGSSDCKNNVIGIFEALEALFSKGFDNKRGIIIALGFDEETSGKNGASHIAEYLLEKLGENSVFAIIDEGGLGVQDKYGSRFAYPSTGEKGYIDIIVTLDTDGGHSSVPPRHTSIGILAEVITEIESELYPIDISPKNPFYYQLQCEAKAANSMDNGFRADLLNLENADAKKRALTKISEDIISRMLISTSQAVDIIYGGVKINALPEQVTVKINNRVAYESSVEIVKNKILAKVSKVADKYGLGVVSYSNETSTVKSTEFAELPSGQFVLSFSNQLDPAPMTSTTNNPTWDLLGGTIRHIFEDFAEFPGSDLEVGSEVTVAPSVMTGNTDTKWYWRLTENIYRFTPIRQNARENAHAIDEKVELNAHIEGVAFFHELVRNFDAYEN